MGREVIDWKKVCHLDESNNAVYGGSLYNAFGRAVADAFLP